MELFKDDIEAARQEGLIKGIFAMIADNEEEGVSTERILEKLEKRFGLTEGEAKEYMEKRANEKSGKISVRNKEETA